MKLYGLLAVLALTLAAGWWLGQRQATAPATHAPASASEAAPTADSTIYTCSMHPQIRQPGKGLCPLCGMDLIPVREEPGGAVGPRELRLSPGAMHLAEVSTFPVSRRAAERLIPMVGKVDYDESRLATITAWVPGRLERLFVDYTGVPVRPGDHLVELFSPEVLTAQQELLQAVKTVRELANSPSQMVRETAEATVRAVREKLRLWGLSPTQIAELEKAGLARDRITINAPIGGIVIEKMAVEGMYVETGMRIYTIADLSQLWVRLEAYESDLAWLRFGQEVQFSTLAYPGEDFTGTISFIDPVLNEMTRTVKVRVKVANPAGRLKPGMLVRAETRSRLGTGGRVMVPELAGYWLCPMHPEVSAQAPGACHICDMPLVKAETLFDTQENPGAALPLVIPASAPLLTGKRALVFVAVPERPGVFDAREIVLGPRAGDWFLVSDGLREGELVVTRGNFKLDSSLQILGKPSMLSLPGGGWLGGLPDPPPAAGATAPLPAPVAAALLPVYEAYLTIGTALAADDPKPVAPAAAQALAALAASAELPVPPPAEAAWLKLRGELLQALRQTQAAATITEQRAAFAPLSESLLELARQAAWTGPGALHEMHCPMAFNDRGATWLQSSTTLANPYFGSTMLRCGDLVRSLPPRAAAPAGEPGTKPPATGDHQGH